MEAESLSALERLLPAIRGLRAYRRADFSADCLAGATVAVMLVPQAMGYAMLAGLQPQVGLYACTAPLIVYALIGSSRHLAVGPVAMVSLLMHSEVAPMAGGDPNVYLSLAVQMALLVGLLQLLMGALRLGVLVNFLSHAVTSGFTSAAALLIMLSQVRHLLGVEAPRGGSAAAQFVSLVQLAGSTHGATLMMAGASIGLILAVRRLAPRAPGPMLAAALGTLAAWMLQLDGRGVALVGSVPAGLPGLTLPPFEPGMLTRLLPAAITISLIGYVESIAIANVLAAREGYRVSANRELAALGAANMAASLVGAYPVTGGLSRTAVNHQAGARTQVASIVAAALVLLALAALAPLFRYTPKAVLAAIVVVSVARLVDLGEFVKLFRLVRGDGWTFALTFAATLLINVEVGLLIGALYSIGLFVWRSSCPRIVEEGFVEADHAFHDISRFPNARTFERTLVFRVDAPLYFANMRFVEDRLRSLLATRSVQWVVFDLGGVNDMDAVAASTLRQWTKLYEEQGIRFAFAGMKGPVLDLVRRAGWPERYCRQAPVSAILGEIGEMSTEDAASAT